MFKKVLAIVLMLSAVLYSCKMEYEDRAAEALLYCENVAGGVWPDYDNAFEVLCTEENVKEFRKTLNKQLTRIYVRVELALTTKQTLHTQTQPKELSK